MARRKKTLEIENTEDTTTNTAPDAEDTQILNSADVEAEEAELLSESAEEAEAVEVEVKPKSSRRRRSAKKSEEVAEAAPSEAPEALETIEVEAAEVPAPRKRRSRAKTAKPEEISVTAQNSNEEHLEQVLKHWTKIQEISNSIAQNFEKVTAQMNPSKDLSTETAEFFKPQSPNSPFALKFATAASIVAALLSVLSLSMSQSARNAVINQEVAFRQAQSAPVKTVSAVPVPEAQTPSVAFVQAEGAKRPIPKPPVARQKAVEKFFKAKH